MPHNPTAINPWTAAQQFNSGEAATSAQYNQLVNNLSLLYAKPWIIVANTASQTLTTGNQVLTGGSPTTITNSPASLAGSITYSSGTLTVPLTGLYRVTMSMSVALQATTAYYQMYANCTGGTSANNHVFFTPRTPTNSGQITGSTGSFILPMQAGGGTYPNTIGFVIGTSTGVSVQGNSLPIGANTTFVQLEYLGTSNGSI